MKRFLSLFLAIIMMLSLSACLDGIDGDEAKKTVNELFDAVENEDYDSAEKLLHPDRPADLKVFFEDLEEHEGLDFSKIEIERYVKTSYAHYDITVDGASSCTLTMDVAVSGEVIDIEIEVVENDSGYGIYNLDIKP